MTILEIAQCQNFRQMTHKISSTKKVVGRIIESIYYNTQLCNFRQKKCTNKINTNVFKRVSASIEVEIENKTSAI